MSHSSWLVPKESRPNQQSPSKPTGVGEEEDNRYAIPLKVSPTISPPDEEQRDPKRVKAPRKLKSQIGEDDPNKVMYEEISITQRKSPKEGKTMEAVTKLKSSSGQDENTNNLGDHKIQNTDGKNNTELAQSSEKPDNSNKPAEAEKNREKDEGVQNINGRKGQGSKNNSVGERKLFVSSTIGVAALVIVALGAHCFSRKPKKQNQ